MRSIMGVPEPLINSSLRYLELGLLGNAIEQARIASFLLVLHEPPIPTAGPGLGQLYHGAGQTSAVDPMNNTLFEGWSAPKASLSPVTEKELISKQHEDFKDDDEEKNSLSDLL